MRGLSALIFVILVVIIIFLMFQINNNSYRCQQNKVLYQDKITLAARLVVQSATQDHPLFSHEHALQAKLIIDDLVEKFGSVSSAEMELNLKKDRLKNLRAQINDQVQEVQSFIMTRIIDKMPEYDLQINEEARLRKKKKRKKRRPHQQYPS